MNGDQYMDGFIKKKRYTCYKKNVADEDFRKWWWGMVGTSLIVRTRKYS